MMSFRIKQHFVCTMIGITSLNCGFNDEDTGGLTANIIFEGPSGEIIQQGLRTAAPPPEIDRLLISVIDVSGSTVASTQLTSDATAESMLNREGGTWQIDKVPVAIDHTLVAQAYFGERGADASQHGRLAFQGIKKNVKVESGKTTNAGTVLMKTVASARIPRLDRTAPQAFDTMSVTPLMEGNGLEVALTPPEDTDFAGAVIAISTSTEAAPPLLTRGSSVAEGRGLTQERADLVVRAIYQQDWTSSIRIYGLEDLQTYQVIAYGFDTDFDGNPLNFSVPISRQGTPTDSSPPGGAQNVTVTASIAGWFQVAFASPGEDGQEGTVAAYEIRAGFDGGALSDETQFDAFPSIDPPEPVPPGQTSTVVARFSDLGVSVSDDFNVGIRAIDQAGNRGPIVVTPYTLSATIAPTITQMSPAVGMASGTITLQGTRFGLAAGRILLDEDAPNRAPRELVPTSWTNEQIIFEIPEDLHSGTLSVSRKDGRGSASIYLAILELVESTFSNTYPVYDIHGLTRTDGTQICGIFTARPNGNSFNNAVEHLVDGARQGTRYETLVEQSPPVAASGALSASNNQLAFVSTVAGTDAINAWLISTSTSSPNNRRNQAVARLADAESLSLQLIDSGSNTVPSVLAASASGNVSVATTTDILSTNFSAFTTVTSTFSDRVQLGRRQQGNAFQYLLAYREGGALEGRLVIQTANGQGSGPSQFSRPNYASRPNLGENVRILDVPGIGFVIAYEERQLGGRSDIRLLKLDDYSSVGFAPYPVTNSNRILQDVGLVTRNGVPYIAVTFTTLAGGSRLFYSEVNPADLVSDGRGSYGALDLGLVAEVMGQAAPQARLSCKTSPQETCSLVWLDTGATGSIYLRR